MSLQKLLILILTIFFIFTLLVVGVAALYKYDPTFFGLFGPKKPTPQQVKKETVKIEPLITLTIKEFDELQSKLFYKEFNLSEKQSLTQNKNKLEDSIKKIYKSQNVFKDSIKKISTSDNTGKQNNQKYIDSIVKLNNIIQKIQRELALKEQQVKEKEKNIDKRADSLKKANFAIYAKIYNNTNPVDIARIMESLDDRDASRILKTMQKKKAGKVLEAMKPEHAAAILKLGSGD